MHLVFLWGASSPPARLWSGERGGSASGHLSVACGLAPSSPPPSGGGGTGVGSLAADALFPASPRLLTLPNSHRTFHDMGIWGESSVSCSRVLSSRESRSSERGSRVDKRARSREVSSRGRRCRSRSLSSYRSRFGGCERGRRSSSASRSSRGRSCCERSRSSDRCRSQRGGSRSRRAWSRSSDRYRSRRDLSRCARSRSFARCRSHRELARFPCLSGVRRVRSRSHALPNRSLDRSRSCVRLPASPAACGPWKRAGWPDVGHRRVWGPLSLSLLWPGAAAGVPPVLGGRPLPLSRLFFPGACQVRHELVWLLFPGSIWSLGGVTASAAASWGIACPASAAAGAAALCAATVTPAGAGVFACCSRCCSWRVCDQQRQGVSRSRGRRSRSSGDGTDRRA